MVLLSGAAAEAPQGDSGGREGGNQTELGERVIKQEMARVNIDILGIGKLKWTGIGEFNSDDHYIYY